MFYFNSTLNFGIPPVLVFHCRQTSNSTRNPGLDQKWSTLDQKWSTLDQIWSTLDQNWSNPKIFFWDFCKYFFAQNSILVNYERSWKNNLWMLIPSCIFRLDQKWSRVDQIWSNLEFRVGSLLVQPRVNSTDYQGNKSHRIKDKILN